METDRFRYWEGLRYIIQTSDVLQLDSTLYCYLPVKRSKFLTAVPPKFNRVSSLSTIRTLLRRNKWNWAQDVGL